jgi:hypothetical protein
VQQPRSDSKRKMPKHVVQGCHCSTCHLLVQSDMSRAWLYKWQPPSPFSHTLLPPYSIICSWPSRPKFHAHRTGCSLSPPFSLQPWRAPFSIRSAPCSSGLPATICHDAGCRQVGAWPCRSQPATLPSAQTPSVVFPQPSSTPCFPLPFPSSLHGALSVSCSP